MKVFAASYVNYQHAYIRIYQLECTYTKNKRDTILENKDSNVLGQYILIELMYINITSKHRYDFIKDFFFLQ